MKKNITMNKLESFIDFEKYQKKVMRGDIEMYDIKGHYEYLTFNELFDWYINL